MSEILNYFQNLWNAELEIFGRHLAVLMVFNILFMLMGRFRFCFISTLIFIYYGFIFANSDLINRQVYDVRAEDLPMLVVPGAVFLGLMVWSFFIESD
jgi:hypothetical protein